MRDTITIPYNAFIMAVNVLRRAGKVEIASELETSVCPDPDTIRLDWLSLQDLNDVNFRFAIDRPHDGEVSIDVGYGEVFGETLRDAIDTARKY